MSITFQRSVRLMGLPAHYLPSGFRPGRYKVVSTAVQSVQGHPIAVGYVLLHKGRLVRSWLR